MPDDRAGAPSWGQYCLVACLCTMTVGASASDQPTDPLILGSDVVGTEDLGTRRIHPLGVVDVGTVPVPRAMAASADESTIYVISDKIAGQVILYDVESERRAGAISVSMLPLTSIVVAPDGSSLFVTSGEDKAQIECINTATMEHTGTLVLSKDVGPITTAVAAPGADAILLGSGTPGKGIVVVDATSFTETATLPLPESMGGLQAVSTLADGSAAYFLSDSTPHYVIGVDLATLQTTTIPLGAESNGAVSIVAGDVNGNPRLFAGVGGSPSRVSVYDSTAGLLGTVNGPSGIPRLGVFDAATDSAIFPVSSRLFEVHGTSLNTQTTIAAPFVQLGLGLTLPGRGEMWFGETEATGSGRLGRFDVSRRSRQGMAPGAIAVEYSAAENALYVAYPREVQKVDPDTLEVMQTFQFTPSNYVIRYMDFDESGGRLIVVGSSMTTLLGVTLKTIDAANMTEINSRTSNEFRSLFPGLRGSVVVADGTGAAICVVWKADTHLLRVNLDTLEFAATSLAIPGANTNSSSLGVPAIDVARNTVYFGFVSPNGGDHARLMEFDLETLEELRSISVMPQNATADGKRIATILLPDEQTLFFSGTNADLPFLAPDAALVDLDTFDVEPLGYLNTGWDSFLDKATGNPLMVTNVAVGSYNPADRLFSWATPMSFVGIRPLYFNSLSQRLAITVPFGSSSYLETIDVTSRKIAGVVNGLSAEDQTAAFAYGASNPGKALIVDKLVNNSHHTNKNFMMFDDGGRGYVRSVDVPLPSNDVITVMAYDDANEVAYVSAPGNQAFNDWTQIVKVDLADASVTASHVIGPRTLLATALALDPDSNSLLVWVADSPPRLLRLDADTLDEIESIDMPAGDAGVHTAAWVPGNNLVLFAKQGPPGSVIRVQVNPLQRLSVRTLTTSIPIYPGGLSVNPETLQGLLFADSSRLYPFDATSTSLFSPVPPIMYEGPGSASGVGVTLRPVMGTTMWDVAMRGTHAFRLDGDTRSFIGNTQPLPVNVALGGPAGLFPQPGRIQAVNRSLQSFSTSTAEQINLQPVAMPHWGVVTDVRLHSHAATGNLRVAIYQDGSSESLLWTSPLVANTAADEEIVFNIADGSPGNLTLSPGDYHLAWVTDTHEQVVSHTPGGTSLSVPHPFLDMPGRLPVQEPIATDVTWTIRATYTPIPQPSLAHVY
jgi:hypothetical protein